MQPQGDDNTQNDDQTGMASEETISAFFKTQSDNAGDGLAHGFQKYLREESKTLETSTDDDALTFVKTIRSGTTNISRDHDTLRKFQMFADPFGRSAQSHPPSEADQQEINALREYLQLEIVHKSGYPLLDCAINLAGSGVSIFNGPTDSDGIKKVLSENYSKDAEHCAFLLKHYKSWRTKGDGQKYGPTGLATGSIPQYGYGQPFVPPPSVAGLPRSRGALRVDLSGSLTPRSANQAPAASSSRSGGVHGSFNMFTPQGFASQASAQNRPTTSYANSDGPGVDFSGFFDPLIAPQELASRTSTDFGGVHPLGFSLGAPPRSSASQGQQIQAPGFPSDDPGVGTSSNAHGGASLDFSFDKWGAEDSSAIQAAAAPPRVSDETAHHLDNLPIAPGEGTPSVAARELEEFLASIDGERRSASSLPGQKFGDLPIVPPGPSVPQIDWDLEKLIPDTGGSPNPYDVLQTASASTEFERTVSPTSGLKRPRESDSEASSPGQTSFLDDLASYAQDPSRAPKEAAVLDKFHAFVSDQGEAAIGRNPELLAGEFLERQRKAGERLLNGVIRSLLQPERPPRKKRHPADPSLGDEFGDQSMNRPSSPKPGSSKAAERGRG